MKSYIVRHKSRDIVFESTSGGVFTAISDYVLDNNGVVYGAVLNGTFAVQHMRAVSKHDRNRMRGSKYVQSLIGNIYEQVKNDLDSDAIVLFTGTPCQVGGLYSFLGKKEYKNLITADIICHGVPSPKVFEKYRSFMSKNNKIVKYIFRDKKKYGWRASLDTFVFDDSTQSGGKLYYELFYGHYSIRPSCFNCKYKSLNRKSDFTIGDAWGIEKNLSSLDDDNGVSLVLVNSSKAENIICKIKDSVIMEECNIDNFLQPCLVENWKQNPGRKTFWKIFNVFGFKAGYNFSRINKYWHAFLRRLNRG